MSFLKAMAISTVVATMLFTGCENFTNMEDDDLTKYGISFDTVSLYNGMGKGTDVSAIDAVHYLPISGVGNDANGYVLYNSEDFQNMDFKSLNNIGRGSTLTPRLVSLNGAKYNSIDSASYYKADRKKIKDLGASATIDTLEFTTQHPYFVAKLANGRGYALAHALSCNGSYVKSGGSTTNTGMMEIEYYHIPDSAVVGY